MIKEMKAINKKKAVLLWSVSTHLSSYNTASMSEVSVRHIADHEGKLGRQGWYCILLVVRPVDSERGSCSRRLFLPDEPTLALLSLFMPVHTP